MTTKFIAALLAASALPSLACAQDMPEPIAFDDRTITSEFIDPSVDPGDDFYGHANNALLDPIEIPQNLPGYGLGIQRFLEEQGRVRGLFEEAVAADAADGTITQKVADAYIALRDVEAIDARGMAPVMPYLQMIDEAKTLDDLARLWADEPFPSPYSSGLSIDRDDPDTYRISIGLGRYLLPDRDNYLVDNDRNLKMRAQAVSYMTDMLAIAGYEDPEPLAVQLLALETEMAREDWGRTLSRKVLLTWNLISREEAIALAGDFPLATYLDAAGIPDDIPLNISNLPPTAEEIEIESFTPEEYENSRAGYPSFMRLVAATPVELWKAWTKIHFFDRYELALPASIRERTEQFQTVELRGNPQPFPRPIRLMGKLDEMIGEGVGQLYVDRYFSPEAKALASDMIENIRTAMRLNLEELEWMGDETRARALEKLAAIDKKVGYPDTFEDYEGMTIVADDPLANAVAVARWSHDDALDRLAKPVDRSRWYMTPQTINAYYSGSMNEIAFPAAFLQPPIFGVERDSASNYGSLGSVIGHEIGHGFDERGSRFDAKGRMANWWTDEDRSRFEAQAERLIAQYDRHCPFDDACVSGRLTLGENIGDLGGIAIAYRAYKLSLDGKEDEVIDGLTGDQRFFLAYAQHWGAKWREGMLRDQMQTDEHSPSSARVNEVVRNFDPWYAAFDVKPDDALYLSPDERVRIWN